MYYTIYKTTNNINGKIYIGKHQTIDINDSYYGSGKILCNAIKKYGKKHFTKEIIHVFDNEAEMNDMEKSLITEEFVKRTDTYNIGIGGEGGPHFKGKHHTQKNIDKMMETRIKNGYNRPSTSSETKLKISNSMKGNKNSLGRKLSPETKRKISETLKNKK